ncbi:MAG: efflux RND transporter periplasmic adaptor subunit [Desulfotignum sp.]|nr:efflux RND transporter periplasmic adaptor subunit [Desulfobacteraceae bacterium]
MKKNKLILALGLLVLIGLGVTQLYFPGSALVASTETTAAAETKPIAPEPPAAADKTAKPLPQVSVETVTPGVFSKTISLSGAVGPTKTARLASPGEGPVESCIVQNCLVREGDQVEKEQVLLQISRDKAAWAQLTAAEQLLNEQASDLDRITRLVEGGAIPGAQLDAAKSKYENAKAQVAKAMESAQDYRITAPWNGIVSRVFVTEGDYVAPRTPLIEIFDPASLVVQFSVPETVSTQMHKNMGVQIQLDAHPGKMFQGTVSRVYPGLDERTRTRTVEAVLAEPVDLLPGMFARIQATLIHIPDAVTVPAFCLIQDPAGGVWAFVVEDGKAIRRSLTTGLEVDGRVQILSGLAPGDQLIIAGQEKLKDQSLVKVTSNGKTDLPS